MYFQKADHADIWTKLKVANSSSADQAASGDSAAVPSLHQALAAIDGLKALAAAETPAPSGPTIVVSTPTACFGRALVSQGRTCWYIGICLGHLTSDYLGSHWLLLVLAKVAPNACFYQISYLTALDYSYTDQFWGELSAPCDFAVA